MPPRRADQLCTFGIIVEHGKFQRGIGSFISLIHIYTWSSQQEFHHFHMTICGSQMKRGTHMVVNTIHVTIRSTEQRLNSLYVPM